MVPDSTKDKNSFLAQYGWTFDLLAADGQSLLDADSPWTRYNNASLYGQPEEWRTAVSYTHLTLPTILRV